MAPPLLSLQDIHLSFGVTPLLTGAELMVAPGERICLVGRNGSGKSSLMRIAAGLIEADSGDRFIHPGATVRYLPQEPDLTGFDTVLAYVEAGLAPGDDPWRARMLLEALGLTGAEHPARLSGGEARRAALARTLAPEPDILFLDEPTNHLDLPAIEWLEDELSRTKSALVLISHDRRFLESLSRATVWLDRGIARRLDKGFAHFEDWRDEVLAAEELEQHKLARQIAREEDWMRYGVTARRKRNVRRVGELKALKERYRTHSGPQGWQILKRRMPSSRASSSSRRRISPRASAIAWSCAISRPAYCAANASAWLAPTGRARPHCSTCWWETCPRCRLGPARRRAGNSPARPEARPAEAGMDAGPCAHRRGR